MTIELSKGGLFIVFMFNIIWMLIWLFVGLIDANNFFKKAMVVLLAFSVPIVSMILFLR